MVHPSSIYLYFVICICQIIGNIQAVYLMNKQLASVIVKIERVSSFELLIIQKEINEILDTALVSVILAKKLRLAEFRA